MNPTITTPTSYTEAHHHVHAARIDHAPIVDAFTGLVEPTHATAKYALRTQVGDTRWQYESIEVNGPWVTADRQPDPRYASYPKTALLLDVQTAPRDIAGFAHRHYPRHLRLTVPGVSLGPGPATSPADDSQDAGDSQTVFAELTTTTTLRHTTDARITDAEPLLVPAHDPGRTDRWMLPNRVTVTYTRELNTPVTPGWRIADLSLTGPWVTQAGEPAPGAVGNARWPGGHRPGWLARHITAHNPHGVQLTTTD